jgi:hypothetical protein
MGYSEQDRKRSGVLMERTPQKLFVLNGFTSELGFRVFAFERIEDDRTRTSCTVRADLALIRRYGIQIQELPLLCRALLDRVEERGAGSLTFTEDDMRTCADEKAAGARELAAKKKRQPQKPSSETPSPVWPDHG